MKRIFKPLLLLCITLMCIISVPSVAHAANYTPGQVKKLKATTSESKITLKWNKVSKAKGYNIYLLDPATNTWKKVKTTSSRSYTIKNATNAKTYTYAVAAYRTVKGKTYEGKKSSTVKATPQVKKPGKVTLRVQSCGNQQVKLKWSKVSGSKGYEIFQYNTSTKRFESIGKVKSSSTSVTVKKLTNGTSYQFKARAYRTVGGITRYGDFSSTVKVKPIAVTSEVKSMPTMTYKAKLKKTINASYTDGSGKVTIKKGTTVTVLDRGSTCKAQLSNGKKVNISINHLNFRSCIYNNKYKITTSMAEDWVNYKGYHSNTNYLIWISTYKQHMYIFKGEQCNWKLIKTFKCSTGRASTPTAKSSSFRIWKKSYFFPFDDYSYANYASYFWGGNAIHSWVKLYANGSNYADGTLGNPASHGCVRLNDSNVKYVYKQIPIGTTVAIY